MIRTLNCNGHIAFALKLADQYYRMDLPDGVAFIHVGPEAEWYVEKQGIDIVVERVARPMYEEKNVA